MFWERKEDDKMQSIKIKINKIIIIKKTEWDMIMKHLIQQI